MDNPMSSTIELNVTIKDNQNHRSQVIAKGKEPVSSRPRSAKERQDALEKIKKFRKRNKKLKKKFSNKIIYIKEKKEEKTSNNTPSKKNQKNAKNIKEKNNTKTKQSTQSIPAKEQEEETNELESTTMFSISQDHYHEEKSNGTTSNTKSLSVSFTDDVISPQTSKLNKKKHQHAFTNNDCTTTEENTLAETVHDNTDTINGNSDNLTLTDSTCTNTTDMVSSTDCITVTSDLNDRKTEDAVEESKKNKCKCWSIISAFGGFVLLFAAYYYGTNMLEQKCKQDIDNYLKNLSIGYQSLEKHFEAFHEQKTDTNCKWLRQSKTKVIFVEKIEGKYKHNIDTFFKDYARKHTTEYTEFRGSVDKLKESFFENQKFYEEGIEYEPVTKYYQEEKIKLERNKELIPTIIELSGFDGTYEDSNGRYELWTFSITDKPVYKHSDGRGKLSSTLSLITNWQIRVYDIQNERWETHVLWENTANTPHPGHLGSQKPVRSDDKMPINHIQITTKLFPVKS